MAFEETPDFDGSVQWVAFSPDGTLLAVSTTGSRNYPGKVALTLNDAKTGEERVDLKSLRTVSSLAFTSSGKHLFWGMGGILVVSDVETGKRVAATDGPTFNSLAVHPKRDLIATGNQTGTVWLWEFKP